MTEEEKFSFEQMKQQIEDIRFLIQRKLGGGSADIKGKIVNPSSIEGSFAIGTGDISSAAMFVAGVVDQAAIGANAVGQSEFKDESIDITVSAGQTVGTGSCTSGSIIIGVYAKTNQDQFIKSVVASGTTITITLLAVATANNVFTVNLIKT